MSRQASPRIGFICPFWLPLWGGAEQYHVRLSRVLRSAGFDVRVFCATPEDPERDNGDIAVERYVPRGVIHATQWAKVLHAKSYDEYRKLSDHYAFIDEAIRWSRANRLSVVLIGNPFQDANLLHVRELYSRLREIGTRVGIVHHDLSTTLSETVTALYLKEEGGWRNAARRTLLTLREMAQTSAHVTEWTAIAGSPLFFGPDFVISNSQWSALFIDPLNQVPKLVLHPLMEEEYWRAPPAAGRAMPPVDVLMVNPQLRKNPDLMKDVILAGGTRRTHRVLKGGWGDAFATFRPLIEGEQAPEGIQADLVDYVDDMREAYRASGLVLFPSFEEGYGMTAVEAMYCGTPVVSSSYPAIVEAVGDGAYRLCPHKDGPDRWIAAVEEVLANREIWSARALERARQLSHRQSVELHRVLDFLGRIAG